MKTKYIKLDGVKNGFAIYLYSENGYVMENFQVKLFKNLNLAETYLSNKYNCNNPYLYKIWIMLEDGTMIDFEDVEKPYEYYEYYSRDNKLYFIEETVINKVTFTGYLVFEDSDIKKFDRKYGQKKSDHYFQQVYKALISLAKTFSPDIIYHVYEDGGHLCARIQKGSTDVLHFCFNSQIMSLNTMRKEQELQCIPFDKNMDKYLSIFVYGTKDMSDPDKNIDKKKIEDDIIGAIISKINYYCAEGEVKYVSVKQKSNRAVTIKGGN